MCVYVYGQGPKSVYTVRKGGRIDSGDQQDREPCDRVTGVAPVTVYDPGETNRILGYVHTSDDKSVTRFYRISNAL